MTPNEANRSLMVAARKGNIDAVRTAIDAGADLNTKDRWLDTPLHWAVTRGHDDVARLLIEKGADRSVRGEYQRTPRDLAANDGRADIVKYLDDAEQKRGQASRVPEPNATLADDAKDRKSERGPRQPGG